MSLKKRNVWFIDHKKKVFSERTKVAVVAFWEKSSQSISVLIREIAPCFSPMVEVLKIKAVLTYDIIRKLYFKYLAWQSVQKQYVTYKSIYLYIYIYIYNTFEAYVQFIFTDKKCKNPNKMSRVLILQYHRFDFE
jgi:hypothetical protein